MRVFIFSTFLSEIFLILGKIMRDMFKDVYWSSCKTPIYSRKILIKLKYPRQIFEKYSNINFHENSSSRSPVVPSRRADNTKLTVAFRSLAIAPNK